MDIISEEKDSRVSTQRRTKEEADYVKIRTERRRAGQISNTGHINKFFLMCLLLTITIGTLQFGYTVGSWNAVNSAYARTKCWDDDIKL